jgi:hypothetical protein
MYNFYLASVVVKSPLNLKHTTHLMLPLGTILIKTFAALIYEWAK